MSPWRRTCRAEAAGARARQAVGPRPCSVRGAHAGAQAPHRRDVRREEPGDAWLSRLHNNGKTAAAPPTLRASTPAPTAAKGVLRTASRTWATRRPGRPPPRRQPVTSPSPLACSSPRSSCTTTKPAPRRPARHAWAFRVPKGPCAWSDRDWRREFVGAVPAASHAMPTPARDAAQASMDRMTRCCARGGSRRCKGASRVWTDQSGTTRTTRGAPSALRDLRIYVRRPHGGRPGCDSRPCVNRWWWSCGPRITRYSL